MDEWINTFFFINIHYLKCSQFHTRISFKENSALCLAEEELPSHDIVAVLPGMNGDHYKAVCFGPSEREAGLMSQHHIECLQVYWPLWGPQFSSYNHGKVQLLNWFWNLQPLCVSSTEEYPFQRAWSRKEDTIFKKNHWNSDTGGKNWVMLGEEPGASCGFWIQKGDAHYRQPCRYSSAIEQFRVKPVFQMTSSKDQASKWL